MICKDFSKEGLNRIGEMALLDLYKKWLDLSVFHTSSESSRSRVILGVGDDCAAIRPDTAKRLLISTDLLTEGVHFRNTYFTPYQLGYKALAVNISDIASMGGIPTQALIGLAIREGTSLDFLEGLYNGFIQTAREYGIQIVGGDTVRSPDGLMLAVTILGTVEDENMIGRKGARPGDRIIVTGDLGTAMLGLEILENNASHELKMVDKQQSGKICGHFLHPIPRVREARVLAENHLATSMIDLSDSLSQDLYHICRSSEVGACIYKSCLPVAPEVRAITMQWGKDPHHYALTGGEDFELLFTLRPEDVDRARDLILHETGTYITDIGVICPSEEGIKIIDEAGNSKPVIPKGFEHFYIWKNTT